MSAKKYTPDDFFTKINNIQDKVRYMDIITPLEKLWKNENIIYRTLFLYIPTGGGGVLKRGHYKISSLGDWNKRP